MNLMKLQVLKQKRRKQLKVETVPIDYLKVIAFSLVNESNKKKKIMQYQSNKLERSEIF